MKIYKKISIVFLLLAIITSCNAQNESKVIITPQQTKSEVNLTKTKKTNKALHSSNQEVKISYSSSILKYKGTEYRVVTVDPNLYEVRLFNKDTLNKCNYDFISIKENLKSKNKTLLMTVNAGMYKPDQSPQGVYIENGIKLNPVDTNIHTGKGNFFDLPPNGVFYIDTLNIPSLITTPEYRKLDSSEVSKIKIATQSGPMMVINGEINTYFNEGSNNLNIRNGVGINGNGRVVFVISNQKINFYDFATFYRDKLNCTNALYLDGAISQMVTNEEWNSNKISPSSHLGPIFGIYKK